MLELELDSDELLRVETRVYQDLVSYKIPSCKHRTLSALIHGIYVNQWENVPPIIVVGHPKLQGKYMVYDGNTRTAVAKRYNLPLKAWLIEDDTDFEYIKENNSAAWKEWCSDFEMLQKDMLSYVTINGEFSKNIKIPLRKHGLLLKNFHYLLTGEVLDEKYIKRIIENA